MCVLDGKDVAQVWLRDLRLIDWSQKEGHGICRTDVSLVVLSFKGRSVYRSWHHEWAISLLVLLLGWSLRILLEKPIWSVMVRLHY